LCSAIKNDLSQKSGLSGIRNGLKGVKLRFSP
jgi:hypothetical protein